MSVRRVWKMFNNDGKLIIQAGNKIPALYITQEVEGLLDVILNREDEFSREEIGWLGRVHRTGSDFVCDELYIPEQEVHGTTTEITPEGLDKLANELMESGNSEDINNLKLWGHSHVNMGVSPSGQDDSQLRDFMGDSDFFIRMIMNKRGKYKVDIYLNDVDLVYENVDMITISERNIEREEQIKQDILNNVSKKTYLDKFTKGTGKSTNSYFYGDGYGMPYNRYSMYDDPAVDYSMAIMEDTDVIAQLLDEHGSLEKQLEIIEPFVIDKTQIWNTLDEVRASLALNPSIIRAQDVTVKTPHMPKAILKEFATKANYEKRNFIKQLGDYTFTKKEIDDIIEIYDIVNKRKGSKK